MGANVGFIGIGNMGRPMAANLVRAGHSVTVYDLDPGQASTFAAEHGARAATGLSDLADCRFVVTMLPTGKEVRQVLLEADGGGAAAHLEPGSIAIDMSSAEPVGTREIGADLAKRGIRFVDAPVSGGVTRAADATLTIMIGGDADAVSDAKPVLSAMGGRLFEVGTLGCGHAMKALNNYLAATSFAATCEAVLIGERFGLDPDVMADIFNVSTGKTFCSENLLKHEILSGRFGSGFAAGLLAKDVKIASDLGEEIGVDAPVSRLVRDRWADARDGLGGGADHTRAAAYWASRAGKGD
ncbi:NAD(P)-dependent oxidoreductase [Microbaculum marinum]|uniref:NAD(P)-dependent oxidoreductase n=1 Tax=Microbaculum marinum TaxID=1764581 RepID=A0AAW9S2B1_9HYPH